MTAMVVVDVVVDDDDIAVADAIDIVDTAVVVIAMWK